VRDPAIHAAVLEEVLSWAASHGYVVRGLTASPIKGPAGNVEFLAHLVRSDAPAGSDDAPDSRALLEQALREAAELV
jgi:23S rRNA (cytidine1920-2'-O)/16S rRNA (cytidine1409-2'-O)-methyltransferase